MLKKQPIENMSREPTTFIRQLTGLRGIAALWVVLLHYPMYLNIGKGLPFGPFTTFMFHGYLGVDIFFVLSGYVLCYKYGESFSHNPKELYATYIISRIARIYPAYLFTLLVVVIFYLLNMLDLFVTRFGNYSYSTLFLSVFMMQSWGIVDKWCWNMPSWTVSTEWLLYLVFPFFCYSLYKVDKERLIILIICLYLASFLSMHAYPQLLLYDAMNFGFIRAIPEFFIGFCYCRIFMIRSNPGYHWDALCAASIIFLIFSIKYSGNNFYCILCISLIVLGLSLSCGFVRNIFLSKPLMFLGTISYSLYLMQFPIQVLSDYMFKHPLPYGTSFLAYLLFFSQIVGLILVSTLVYYWIERPSRRLIANSVLLKSHLPAFILKKVKDI